MLNREIHTVLRRFDWVAQVKATKPTLLVLLAIGGWDLVPYKLRPILDSATEFPAFKRNVIAFLHLYGFDGLHLDLTLAKKQTSEWDILLVEKLVEASGRLVSWLSFWNLLTYVVYFIVPLFRADQYHGFPGYPKFHHTSWPDYFNACMGANTQVLL